MVTNFLFVLFIGGTLGTYVYDWNTYGMDAQNFLPRGYRPQQQNYQHGNTYLQTSRSHCCRIMKCVNKVCEEREACGDSCLNPEFAPRSNTPTRPLETETASTIRIKCCLMKQCSNGVCQQMFTCGEQCQQQTTPEAQPERIDPNYSEHTIQSPTPEKLENKPKPFLPSRNPSENSQPNMDWTPEFKPFLPSRNPSGNSQPNMDWTPEFKPLPGITMDETSPDSKSTTQKTTSTTKKTTSTTAKPEKCEPSSKVNFPEEDDEDYGATPGYDLKHEYKREKCDKGSCKNVTFKCGQCPDPFDPNFRLYNVRKECFHCYEISCTLPEPK